MTRASLILASGSPRRRELLSSLGVAFEVITAEVSELDGAGGRRWTAPELALANARLKAEAVARLHPGRWVLGADTVVFLDGPDARILGKPANIEEAREFLRLLSGLTHGVVTACVLISPKRHHTAFDDRSRVKFRSLNEATITRYLDQVDVMDKAGAYAIQECGELLVFSHDGSRSNIIGLPLEKLAVVLRAHGLAT